MYPAAQTKAGESQLQARTCLRQIKEPVPGVCALFAAGPLLPVHHLIKPACADPVQQRPEGSGLRVNRCGRNIVSEFRFQTSFVLTWCFYCAAPEAFRQVSLQASKRPGK